ncbi:exodeoxyribonuclease VII small subunit [Schaalia sp. 19OD2882]|uniref:exodeoxyribonuclease VII small subunit n=1 Tax=Schaalia sp. 19OD2882 TaxID=2794089 RepID=UPI001C1F170D|nr:exodeoxyribonuclease VII small subunit [Schaalia sp. 19OD2882]QWW20203.1 exodeoxyribonuclease VII small subunit [Schaalia sp. 19OD2882]
MTRQERPDPQALSYEEARDELVAIVRQLEGGQAPLEATMELWERGEALAGRCRTVLEDARARLDRTQAQSSVSEATN